MKASRIVAAIAALAFTAGSGVAAEAAQITYTFSGLFDGSLNGGSFSDTPITLTGIGDTSKILNNGYSYYEQLTSLSAQAVGQTFQVTEPSFFYINENGYAGLEFGAFDDSSYFSGHNANLLGYNGATSVASSPFDDTSFDAGLTASVTTQLGDVTLTGDTNGTFSAATSAVPEPVTWAMMIGGFGLVGGMMRRAHRKSEDRFTNQVRAIAAA